MILARLCSAFTSGGTLPLGARTVDERLFGSH
jgi:hypothetical protein